MTYFEKHFLFQAVKFCIIWPPLSLQTLRPDWSAFGSLQRSRWPYKDVCAEATSAVTGRKNSFKEKLRGDFSVYRWSFDHVTRWHVNPPSFLLSFPSPVSPFAPWIQIKIWNILLKVSLVESATPSCSAAAFLVSSSVRIKPKRVRSNGRRSFVRRSWNKNRVLLPV